MKICVICGKPALQRLKARTCGNFACQHERRLETMKLINRKKYRKKIKKEIKMLEQKKLEEQRKRNEFIKQLLFLNGVSIQSQNYNETKDYPERVATFRRIEKAIGKELPLYIKSEAEPDSAPEKVKEPKAPEEE